MPRDLPLSNGRFLVNFDSAHNLRDIYFPHVGTENHAYSSRSSLGVWVDGCFRWLEDEGWRRSRRYAENQLTATVTAENPEIGLELEFTDSIDFYLNGFIRRLAIRNMADSTREVRVFSHHDIAMGGNAVGDTAYYDPSEKAVIAYKNVHYMLVGGGTEESPGIDSWTMKHKDRNGSANHGSRQDAEDGALDGRPIAFGSVDFVVGLHPASIPPHGEIVTYMWITVGSTPEEVINLQHQIRNRGPDYYLHRTAAYWRGWVNKERDRTARLIGLPGQIGELYKRSLLIVRAHADSEGALIAAPGSDMSMPFHNRDPDWQPSPDDPFHGHEDYAYCWPRDGALVAIAMDKAGYGRLSGAFLRFCTKVMTHDGQRLWTYMQQKFTPTGALGSNVIPWVDAHGRTRLPIQEDETALTLIAFCHHYQLTGEWEFMARFYAPLVTGMANFMSEFRDPETGLPLPSQDLWEERDGIHAFTVATVWRALMDAAELTELLDEPHHTEEYRGAAEEIKRGVEKYMYDRDEGRFVRTVELTDDGRATVDKTVDASLYSLAYFGMFQPDDPRIVGTVEAIRSRLSIHGAQGGLARFEGDRYQLTPSGAKSGIPGNPWFLCSLWDAQYEIMLAKSVADLASPLATLEWVADHALPSGVLAEQMDSATGDPVGAGPLTWSHGTFVLAVCEYLDALERIRETTLAAGR